MTESDRRPRRQTPILLRAPWSYLVAFAVCGWLILIANLFGLAGKAGWIFPVVDDLTGLTASTLILLVLALTPIAVGQLFGSKGGRQ